MKTTINLFGVIFLSFITFGTVVSCTDSPIDQMNEMNLKSAELSESMVFPDLVVGEDAGILLMREEEKMARDVYTKFYEIWKLPVFQNISASENNHYEAIGSLIKAYSLKDPSTGVVGTFSNESIAGLYKNLTIAGAASVIDALKTGAYIEEYDILDLEKLLAETKNPAIQQIYGNLLRGSRNHLRAFTSSLLSYEVTYIPQLLKQSDYETIVNSPTEQGNSNKNGNGNKNNGGKGNSKGKGKRG